MKSTEKKHFTPTKGTLVALMVVAMLNCMGGAAVAPALPAISAAFPEASQTMVTMVISLPALSVAISGMFVGLLADKIGKARVLVVSLVVFTVTGLVCVVLPSLELILVMRFILGVAMAGAATASTALIADYYDDETQTQVLGMQSAFSGVSILVLETSGGFLALVNWRVPFLVYTVGIVMLVLTCLFVREATGQKVGLNGNVVSESDGSTDGTGEGRDPMRRVLRPRTARAVLIMCLLYVMFSLCANFLVPSKLPYVVTEFGGSTAIAGLMLGAFGLANIVSSLAYPHLVRHTGRFTLLIYCYGVTAIGLACIAIAHSMPMLLIGSILVNLGIGCAIPLLVNWIASVSTRQNSGRNMGLFTGALNMGQFIASIWAGAYVAYVGSEQSTFAVGALICVVLAIVSTVGRLRFSSLQQV